MIVLALKIIPYKKNILYSVFFMPMLLALASVYSTDGIGVALITLFIAYCLKLFEKDKINKKELVMLLLLLFLAIFAKSVGYIGVALIIFILPLKNILKQNKKYIKYIIPLFIILFVIILFIYKENINTSGDLRSEGSNTRKQFEYVINNPFEYGNTLIKHTVNTFSSLLGMSFLNAPMFFRTTYYIVFIVSIIYLLLISITDSTKQLNVKNRIIFIFTFFVVFAMTSTAMYLSYTKVGANYIEGHQMRYIFPTLPLILMSISIKKIGINMQEKFKNANIYISYPMVIFLMISVLDVTII